MKKIALTAVAIIAASSALAPLSAQAYWFKYDAEKSVENSKRGGMVVRNIWSDKPLGTCGATMCAKPEDAFASLCLGKDYNKASAEEKKRIQQVLSRSYDYVVVMDVGLFITGTAGIVAKKGTVRVGDAVSFRTVSRADVLPNTLGLDCTNPNKQFLMVDQILKHHDGTILYSNGHMLGGAPSNEKPVAKPAQKPVSILD